MNIGNLFSACDFSGPNFLTSDADVGELSKQVRRIVLPDGIKSADLHAMMRRFSNLESVSMSIRDYYYVMDKNDFKLPIAIEMRMPKEGKMIHTDKIEEALEKLIPKYAYTDATVYRRFFTGHDTATKMNLLYIAYLRASFAWTEDLALTCLVLTGLEYNGVGFRDIKPLVDEDIYHVVKEYMEIKNKPPHEVARYIKETPLLLRTFSIYRQADINCLGITDNEKLFELIEEELDYGYDLGLKFKGNVSVVGTVMHGFEGTGTLKHCAYTISGMSTPETNLELIRITSKYPQRDYQSLRQEKKQNKLKEEANIIPTIPSYLMPKFEFLEQSWLGYTAMGGLWSYPSGAIYHEGEIKDTRISVASITTELCYLGALFKNLRLAIIVRPSHTNYIILEDCSSICFKLIDGKVSVEFDRVANFGSQLDDDKEEQAKYNRLLREGKPLLDKEKIAYMTAANKLDKERYENDESKARLHELLTTDMNSLVFHTIMHYMDINYNWKPDVVYKTGDSRQLLTHLFDIDVEKVDQLFNAKVMGLDDEDADDTDEFDEYDGDDDEEGDDSLTSYNLF